MKQRPPPVIMPTILGLYFFPMLFCYLFLPHSKEERVLFVIGIITISLCSLILFLLLKKYEYDVQARIFPQLADAQQQEEQKATIANLQKELHAQETSLFSMRDEYERAQKVREEEFFQQRAALQAECGKQTHTIEELQQALEKSCQLATDKEDQIAALRSELSQLQFELKTVAHAPVAAPQPKPLDVPRGTASTALGLLDDALHTALLLAESGQLKGATSRLFGFSSEALAIENRRLFEALQKYESFPLFVFCKKEEKLLFAAGPFQERLGWTLEELQRNFFASLIEGKEELQRLFKEIYPFETKKLTVNLAGRRMHLVLGVCPLPPFSQCVIAVADVKTYRGAFATA